MKVLPAGGGSRNRTGDILLAKQTLYQLSYTPARGWTIGWSRKGDGTRRHAGLVWVSTSPPKWLLLRKEVIQPLVPQRLPCYDFIPITTHTLD